MDAIAEDFSAMRGGLESNATPQSIDLHRHIALFRRRLRLFVAIVLVVFVAAALVIFQLPKKYTATSEVMLDPRHENVTNVQDVLSGLPPDTAAVDTEVEVIKSRSLAEKVVQKLNLDRDPEFNPSLRSQSPFWGVFGRASSEKGVASPQALHNAIVDHVMSDLKVARSGLTYAIKISFTGSSPEKSAEISNAFADNYLLEQLDAKFEATRRASDWLNTRLGALRGQVEAAEGAVAEYKAAHGLMNTTAEGVTIAQQEISGIDTQLTSAKAQEAEAEANLSTAHRQLQFGSSGDDLGAALNSPVINQLRSQRAQISSQVADMQGRLGPRHPDMLKAQRQLADVDAQIQSEIRRITSNLEAQVQVARQRTGSIEGSLARSKGVLASNGAASVQLNNLQRNAESLSTLYQTYLDRFKQTSNQTGMEQSDSRVVSRAKVPSFPSFPNKPLYILLAAILSILTAVGVMLVVEALENGLYTSEDVEKIIGLPHIGSIGSAASTIVSGEVNKSVDPVRLVVEKPLSTFAEAFRNLRTSIVASRVGHAVKVVAITSALPGEGKTTTSICLGRVVGLGGGKVVVVDCDLRRRTVNRLFDSEPTVGLLEVISGHVTLEDALILDDASGAYFLPLAHVNFTPKEVFGTVAMDNLLAQLRSKFDLVILDTAPILPVADTRVLAPKADITVFVAQWKKTPRKAIENAVRQLDSVGAFVAGIALTQVDMKEQARSGYGDAGYYYRSYKQYYNN